MGIIQSMATGRPAQQSDDNSVGVSRLAVDEVSIFEDPASSISKLESAFASALPLLLARCGGLANASNCSVDRSRVGNS
jgi:hypothetical protein